MDGLYENIGGKIKNWAVGLFGFEAISCIIAGIVLIVEDFGLEGFLLMILGPFAAWVGSWILYAFGELVEDTHAIRNKVAPAVENAAVAPSAYAPTYTAKTSAYSAPINNGWTCRCGKNHAAYEMSCVCGLTKAEGKVENATNTASRILSEAPAYSAPIAGGWACTCGRNHAAYEMSCVCGMTKADAKLKNSANNE